MTNKKMHSKIEIKSMDGTYTEVFIDGHLIHGIRSMHFEKKGREIPILTMDLNALDISVDSPMILRQEGYEDIEITFKGENRTI